MLVNSVTLSGPVSFVSYTRERMLICPLYACFCTLNNYALYHRIIFVGEEVRGLYPGIFPFHLFRSQYRCEVIFIAKVTIGYVTYQQKVLIT
jgi:hypothetical protein